MTGINIHLSSPPPLHPQDYEVLFLVSSVILLKQNWNYAWYFLALGTYGLGPLLADS